MSGRHTLISRLWRKREFTLGATPTLGLCNQSRNKVLGTKVHLWKSIATEELPGMSVANWQHQHQKELFSVSMTDFTSPLASSFVINMPVIIKIIIDNSTLLL